MSVNFTEFSEYMVGQHGDKIEKNPKLFYQLAQKYRGERMGMVLFSGLPNDFILKHSSLSEVLDFRREMSYRDDNYEREYDDIISKFFLFGDIDDSEIIKLLNTYTENNDSYTLYVLFKNLEAETIVRIRDDIDIFKGIKFDANGYATEEYANLTEIFDVFDNTFISGVDDYKGYLEGETIDIWDYDISDYQVDKIVDCIIKEDNSWKIKFKNYINNNSDYGDNIWEIIESQKDEVWDAFYQGIVSGVESGTESEIYNKLRSTVLDIPFYNIEEIKNKTKEGYEYTEKFVFKYSVSDLFYLLKSDSEAFEQFLNGENLPHIIKDHSDYEFPSFYPLIMGLTALI